MRDGEVQWVAERLSFCPEPEAAPLRLDRSMLPLASFASARLTARVRIYPFLFALWVGLTTALRAADDYKLGPDSEPQSVPRGEVRTATFNSSKVFPGTTRDYLVYVPKQYDASKPACLMVFFDGAGMMRADGAYRVPVVFDNLIAKKEMPVTIAVAINPGTIQPTLPNAKPRSNRSFEYDSLGDANARFLLEELLPEATKGLNITKDPAGRAICGNSSGGIAAFTVAWERPDEFRKVVSHIGSFTNIRGGHVYPAIIRKTKPVKPLRVFLQDGSNDLDNLHGNWPLANQDMAAALKFAGYDHKFVLGDGGHSGKHGGSIFPDTLRWLWRDWPKE
jgi:enterochelin esterase-like enzyme